jgi:hypothetical protein
MSSYCCMIIFMDIGKGVGTSTQHKQTNKNISQYCQALYIWDINFFFQIFSLVVTMPPKKKLKDTRASTDVFLVGQPRSTPLTVTKPLTNGDMVRYLHWRTTSLLIGTVCFADLWWKGRGGQSSIRKFSFPGPKTENFTPTLPKNLVSHQF